jgi:endo-alpha-N-acetylgalactosaminidase
LAVESHAKLIADNYSPGFEPGFANDGDPNTYWQTEFVGASPGYPHEVTIDLRQPRKVDGLFYLPRQDSSKGRVKAFEIRLGLDGKAWSEPVARGVWSDDPAEKVVVLPGREARFVQLRGLSEVNGSSSISASEISVDFH